MWQDLGNVHVMSMTHKHLTAAAVFLSPCEMSTCMYMTQ